MDSRRPTILLFDIDGTLVTTAGAGRRALEGAFKALYGREDACQGFRFDGMTDRLIARMGLEAIGVEVTERNLSAVLDLYIPLLANEVSASGGDRYRVHRGVVPALNAAVSAGAALGLGTGNIEAGARIKLERVGLFHYFDFGGYGCDSAERSELIGLGAARGATKLGVPLDACRVVVIGDTPKDIMAARAIGAESIGVGTGSFTKEALLDAGATHAFEDLAAEGAIDALLEQCPPATPS